MNVHDIIMHPLSALFVTIGSYVAAQWLQKKLGNHSIANPVIIAIAMVVGFLVVFDIPYADYLANVDLIHSLLGPVTVALALPLYHHFPTIKKNLWPIFSITVAACFVAASVAYGLAHYMEAAQDIQLSIIPKSVTMPIAIGIAEKIGTNASLAVFFVFTTGIIGTLIATAIFKICRITSDSAIGFSLGITCHGLGVAKAFQHSKEAGAFAALGMSLMGIVSGIILPIWVLYFLI